MDARPTAPGTVTPTALPTPQPPIDAAVRERFRRQRRDGTQPETALRSELHRRGRRFRVQYPVPGLPRRRVDIAFTRHRVAVFVDGCFWHGCPDHFVPPIRNRDWWLAKIEANRLRDQDTDRVLRAAGWEPIRVWEHLAPGLMADVVERRLGQE
ncbi:very short patch repair endonuclease [Terrabacter sp. Soil810]|uniref:very short patch repair endonuclease n=1 Tax=Terrabacter sp. Soil810 TaxID=1736418 RepID=UPI0009EBA5CF|nr:very short patch repair endonuclease [Terrabacter sp. Soil810]